MRCHKAQRYISESIDGDLDPGQAARLERHLKTCASCRVVLEDFRAMTGAAPRLAGPEPGNAVWQKIKTSLAAQAARPAVVPKPAAAWSPSRWNVTFVKLAGAAALALLLIGSGIFFGLRMGRQRIPANPEQRVKYAMAKLDEAERHYAQAIKSLSEAFEAQKGAMPPQVADIFEKNLAALDATIQSCRQTLSKGPEDIETRNYLLAAYMDKMNVLDTALEFQRRNPGAAGRGQIL